jgi:hypothetical protein
MEHQKNVFGVSIDIDSLSFAEFHCLSEGYKFSQLNTCAWGRG